MSAHAIHHVTAVTGDIQANYRFYTKTLGLRLVKQSVNQDDVSAYHLFYADKVGSPGTDMTFFDWPFLAANVSGPGQVSLTSFRVPVGSLDYWERRLGDAGHVIVRDDSGLRFSDDEGQRLELVEDDLATNAVPWSVEVPEEHALRGILGVDIESGHPDRTVSVIEDILGLKALSDGTTFVNPSGSATVQIRVRESAKRSYGRIGSGGVHHVAFRVRDDQELLTMQSHIEEAGLATSGFIDRYYFHSVYFREPGGTLFEIATDGPGFATDESAETLGARLALPPFLEPRRREIEAGLRPFNQAELL